MRNSKAKATGRKRVAPRLSAKAIAPQPTEEAQELPLELFLEDDELSAPLDEAVGATPQWNSMDIHEEGVEDLMSDAATLHTLPEAERDVEEEEASSGIDNPVLLYLQEAGTVALLKPEDEVRLAKQIVALKARLREVVEEYGPQLPEALSAETTTPTEAEDWVVDVVRRVRGWISRLEHGEEAEVQRDVRLPPQKI